MKGLKKPHDCPAFGKQCTPQTPLGATMVSGEGACAAYYDALADGEIPLCFLVSGTIFYETAAGGLLAMQIPWDKEAYYRLPASTYRELRQHHHRDCAWLSLRQDMYDRLCEFKSAGNHATWEQALDALLTERKELATP